MRLLQHSVRNALIICMLLVSASAVAASPILYVSYLSYSNGNSSLKGLNVGDTMSSDMTLAGVRCGTYTPGASSFKITACTAEHLAGLNAVCTIKDEPYIPGGMNVDGYFFEIKHRLVSGGESVDITEVLSPSGSLSQIRPQIFAKESYITTNLSDDGRDVIDVKCRYSGTSSVPMYYSLSGAQAGEQVTSEFTAKYVDVASLNISIEQPSPIVGKLMTTFESPFKMTTYYPSGRKFQLAPKITWDVSAPCDSWSPTLQLTDGTILGIHNADTGNLLRNSGGKSLTNIMTARFTPTTLGAFSCTGTLIVSFD